MRILILSSAVLALLLGLGTHDGRELAALIRQLGSEVAAESDAAALELERLGAEALPVLRVATDSRNPRIRERAVALLNRIEGGALLQSTEIRLDFDDRPLPEVVAAINQQGGSSLALFPELDPELMRRKVTLREPGPVPFWRALDELCEAGRVHLSLSFPESSPSRVPAFRLVDGPSERGFVSYSGPFRLMLVSIQRERTLSLDRVAGTPQTDSERFFARLEVFAEPRMILGTDEMPRLTEATDDLGQSLIGRAQSGRGYPFGPGAVNRTTLPIPMEYPKHPGRTIVRMKGVVPVTVAVRESTPLTIPLDESVGKTFRHAGLRLDILSIHPDPAGRSPRVIDLLLRPDASDEAKDRVPTGRLPLLVAGGEWDLDQNQFEVFDAQGRPIPWLSSTQRLPEGLRGSLRPRPPEANARPVTLRFYGLIRRRVDVPFEFESVPMP